jgi:hypothetical protein
VESIQVPDGFEVEVAAGPDLVSFCRETLGMAIFQAIRTHIEAPEWQG